MLLKVAKLNTQHFPPEDRSGAVAANIAGVTIACLATTSGTAYSLHGVPVWPQVMAFNILLALSGLAVPLFQLLGRLAPAFWLAFASSATILGIAWIIGSQSGVMLNLAPSPALALMILGHRRVVLAAAMSILMACVIVTGTLVFDYSTPTVWSLGLINTQTFISGITTTMVLPFVVVYSAMRAADRAERGRRRLLEGIMPPQIVEELLDDQSRAVVRSIDNASVCFADISGFVAISARLGPERTVALLDDLFSTFDDIAASVGVQKVKTIGDAYLAAAGVTEPSDAPDRLLADYCFAIMKAARQAGDRHGVDLTLRIGLASGPVSAGVIGRAKQSFDIWGMTVNLAARLEAIGHPNEVVTTDDVRDRLVSLYDFHLLGTEEMKGIGPNRVWRMRERASGNVEQRRQSSTSGF